MSFVDIFSQLKKWHLFLVLGLINLCLIAGAYYFYNSAKERVRNDKIDDFETVSQLKINQITQWNKERLSEAEYFANNDNFITNVKNLIQNKNERESLNYFTKRLIHFKKNNVYDNIFISSTNGEIFFTLDSLSRTHDSLTIDFIQKAVSQKKLIFTDFYYCPIREHIHYSIISPVFDENKNVIAAIVFIINPDDYLYPAIKSWPVKSRSGETLVVRKEGNDVLFLSELRNDSNFKLTVKIPVTRKEVLAVKGILGENGITEGKDYSGKEVLGDIQKIPGTNWIMISKMDIDEVYEELSYLKILLGFITIVLSLLIGSGIILVYEYSQSTLYKKMYLKEKDLNKTREELRTTLYSIGDGVITTSITGQISRMNLVAENLTGWNENEAQGKILCDIFKIIDEKTDNKIECPIEKTLQQGISKSLSNNTLLVSKNERRIPVSYSSSPIKNEDKKIIGAVLVFKDETKEYTAKKLLRESETKFSKIFHNSPVGISIARTDGTLLDVNQIFLNESGYSYDEVIGKTSVSLSFWKNLKDGERFINLLSKNGTVPKMEVDFRMKSGEIRTCFISAELITIGNEQIILSSLLDITDRKIFETAFQKSQAQLTTAIELAHLGYWEYDVEYDLFTFNDQFYKMLRTSTEKEGGYTMSSTEYAQRFVHPDDLGLVGNEIRKAIEAEDPSFCSELEHRIKYADGEEGVITVRFNIIKDKDNRTIKTYGVNQDITQRKLAEKSLRDKEELLSEMGKTANVGGWEFDVVTSKGTWTEQVAHIHDLDPSLETNANIGLQFYTAESRNRIEKSIKDAIEFQQPYDLELELISAKGIHKWVRTIGKPVIEYGKVVRMRGSFQDITDRRNAEEVIRASEKKFSTAFHISPDSVNINRLSDGLFIDVNQGFCKATGYKRSEVKGKTSKEINIWVNQEERDLLASNLIKFGEVINMEAQFRTKDGSVRIGLMSAKKILINNEECILSITRDITERKKAEDTLTLFNTLINQSNDIIEVIEPETLNYIYINEKGCSILGYTPEEIRSLSVFDIDPLVNPLEGQRLRQELMEKGSLILESLHKRKNGSTFPVEINLKFVQLDKNYVLSVVRDITERKQAEEKIRKLSRGVEQSPSAIIITDYKGFIEYVNPKFTEVTGYSFDEVKGEKTNILKSGNTSDDEYKELWKTISNKKEWRGNFLNKKKNGELFWEAASISPILNRKGEITNYIAIKEDITEKKKMEEMLSSERLVLRTLIDNLPDAIYIKDTNCRKTLANVADIKNLRGETEQDIIGKTDFEFFPKEIAEGFIADDLAVINTGKQIINREEFFIDEAGQTCWLLTSKLPLKNSKNQIVGLVGIGRDITKRKLMEFDLIKAKEQAEEMNRIKSYFYANISHELRTPFVGIMGYAELLKDTLADPEEKEMAEVILNSSKRLTDTLNKILSITKLEFDKAEINLQSVDVFTLIKNLQILYSKSAQQQNTIIKTSFKCRHFFIKTDENLLQEILSNLVNNAVKFTANGVIELITEIIEREEKNYFVIKVKDSGIGISKDKQDLIWQEFRQASEGFSRSFEGTGLGLSIAKRYANLLEGNISVESEQGKGSVFTVELPLIETSSGSATGKPDIAQSDNEEIIDEGKERFKILYVEDDPISMSYVKKVLSGSYDLDEAASGEDAIQKIKNNIYSALLVDINLGDGIDGVQLTQMIRQLPEYKSIPIIAITAYASANDRDEFLSKGFSYHLPKPFFSSDLLELLEDVIKEKIG